MATKKKVDLEDTPAPSQSELVQAFVSAIEASKPPQRKNATNRKKQSPWMPKDGSTRLKLKRKMYHHGLLIGNRITNEEISLLNQVRPGVYCDGHVKVNRRRDKGIDIDYPIKTASQRLRLVNMFGIRNFQELLARIVYETENPTKFAKDDLE